MSDFDTVLERLLTEPGFARALAADPGRALAGYQLTAEEVSLLRTQVSEEAGGDHAVETRTSQSSLAGLFGPIGGSGSAADFSSVPPAEEGFGAAPGLEPDRALGSAPGADAAGHAAGRGAYPTTGQGGEAGVERGLGAAGGGESYQGLGTAPDEGFRGLGAAPPAGGLGEAPPVPEGYATRVDADGDGVWDPHTLHGAPGGGVEIHVDLDGDGRVDFIGHDVDADGLVDWAEYDRDGDGRWDVRMYDVDGDGWMDRAEDVDSDPKE